MTSLRPLLPPPDGFEYREDAVNVDEERVLIGEISKLTLKPFDFQGYEAKRRVASFGWRYDYGRRSLTEAQALPDFLLPLREKAASLADITPEKFVHSLVTEYTPGTPIGWHRDRSVFGDVVGISLLSRCTFRFRRKIDTKWERHSVILEPRSIYLLRGPARTDWEHSIPEVDQLRYSITFRTVR
jgi:alkylated DNA repair dioxygenase AlkB